jgi:hypothetical protein
LTECVREAARKHHVLSGVVPYEDGAVQHVPREGVGMGDREEDGLKTSIRIAIATLLILSYDSTHLRDRALPSIPKRRSHPYSDPSGT